MRKLVAAAVVTITALTLSGAALAANVYTVGRGQPHAGRAASNAKPRPMALNFDFQVEDQNPDLARNADRDLRDRR